MTLIQCTRCGKKFSDERNACPNCGTPIEDIYNDYENEEENDESFVTKIKNSIQENTSKYLVGLIVVVGIAFYAYKQNTTITYDEGHKSKAYGFHISELQEDNVARVYENLLTIKKAGYGEREPNNLVGAKDWLALVDVVESNPEAYINYKNEFYTLKKLGTDFIQDGVWDQTKEEKLLKIYENYKVKKEKEKKMRAEAKKAEEKAQTELKKSRNLVGEWDMMIEIGINEFEHELITIYKEKGKYYYGEDELRSELIKKGNKYYVVGSTYGDYYEVSGNRLYVGDRDGRIDTYCGVKRK